MTYVVKDKYHSLVIKLKTKDSSNTLELSYKVNGSLMDGDSPTSVDDGLIFTIPFNALNVGDEITEIKISRIDSGVSPPIYDTNEGVNILLNGDDYSVREVENNTISTTYSNPVHTQKFAINFDNTGDYTLQTVYAGNSGSIVAYSPEYTFNVDVASSQDNDSYTLEFTDPSSTITWTYGDNSYIEYKLSKNGSGVSGKTVESVTPTGISSAVTDNNGLTGIHNLNYNVGTYSVGSYYAEDGHIVAKTNPYRTLVIKKANAVVTYDTGTITKNSKFNIWLKDSNGTPIANEKISVYVNGKLKSKTTNSSGKISFTPTSAQTYKFKVVYKGNSNINPKTQTITKVVANG